jgi:hypothetical protein
VSLASGDLTTLAAIKGYINSAPTDTVLQGLITRISRFVLGELNRPLLVPKTYAERYRMNPNVDALVLFNWPVLSVASVAFADFSPVSLYSGRLTFESWSGIPPGEPISLGFPDGFARGGDTMLVTYKAGYAVSGEVHLIPGTPFKVTPAQPYGQWATDEGVTYTNGSVLTPIASGTPSPGQYLPPDPNASPARAEYLFAAGDVGQSVILSYGYIPGEIEQLVIELIAERSAYRMRVGLRSQSLAGQETITYDTRGLPDYAQTMLRPYKNVLPPPIGVFA